MTPPEPHEDETGNVAARVRRSMDVLPPAERRAARTLLAAYPVAGLETVSRFAERAGVSAPTIVRLVARLGFSGYPEFQRSLRHEVDARMGSPVEQYAQDRRIPAGTAVLPYVSETFARILAATFDELPPTEFSAAVDLLCDPRRRILLAGGRFSRNVAVYLASHLQILRPDVRSVADGGVARLAAAADLRRGDVVVVFDFRRYDDDLLRLSRRVAEHGGVVVLFTDRWLSPVAEVARHVLPARVESPSPFDSLVPALALAEGVVTAVTERLGDAGRARAERIEAETAALRGDVDPATPPARNSIFSVER